MAELIAVDAEAPQRAAIARAAECLRRGGLVAFPTETVYGLGAHALDRVAVRRVFVAKGRPSNDPLIVHVNGLDDLAVLTSAVPPWVEALADRFWPGPLTLVLRRSAAVPDEVTAHLETVAIRVPANPVARALIAAAGVPVAAPSANLFSRPSPTTATHVLDDLGDRIDIVLDAGPTTIGVESTVLDLSGDVPMVLRPGAVTREMLLELLPRVDGRVAGADITTAMRSPGMLTRHYSPRAPLTLYSGTTEAVCRRINADAASAIAQGQTIGVIAADDDDITVGRIARFGPLNRPDVVAARLYSLLRELDAAGVDLVLARQFPSDDGLGQAVRDRLSRAAAGRVIICP